MYENDFHPRRLAECQILNRGIMQPEIIWENDVPVGKPMLYIKPMTQPLCISRNSKVIINRLHETPDATERNVSRK